MVDFTKARVTMVDCQVRTVDVTDYDVLDAFSAVPREEFLPEALKPLAYLDDDLLVSAPGEPARYVMEAGPLARLVQLAEIKPTDKVLDLGPAGGYSSAILARIAARVIAVEPDPALAEATRANVARLGIANVSVVSGALVEGHAAEAPYDVIIVEGAIEFVPEALERQLAENGRIVAVVGVNGLAAKATIFTRTGGTISGRPVFNTHVKPLPEFQRPKAFVF